MKLALINEDVAMEAMLLMEEQGHQPTVAVDLDGTLANDYVTFDPDVIAKPRKGARKALKKFRRWGFKIIIFTVRGNTDKIAEWLKEHDIPYDDINHNDDQPPNSSGKIIADVYLDDRAIDGTQDWRKLAKMVKKRLRNKRAA